MTPSRWVSIGEFELLRATVSDNAHRLDSIDTVGTRGVAVVQSQLTDLSKDVAGLTVRMDKHDDDHKREESDRRAARRWFIATMITALVLIEGPLGYLITHLHGLPVIHSRC